MSNYIRHYVADDGVSTIRLAKENVELDTDQVNDLVKSQIEDYVKVVQTSVNMQNKSSGTLKATIPSGYKFVSWLGVYSSGITTYCTCDASVNPTTVYAPQSSTNWEAKGWALIVKDNS